MSFNWSLFFDKTEKINLYRLASIFARDYSLRTYNAQEDSLQCKKIVLDIMLLVSDAINIKQVKGEVVVSDRIVRAKEILEMYSMSNDMPFEYMLEEYSKATVHECSFVYAKEVVLWLYAMPDGIEFLPPSLIEYLDNENKACHELPTPQSPQFKNIDFDAFPLIRDVITMLEKGKSKGEITDYLTTKKIANATIGILLHENPYGVSHEALQQSAKRLKNKNS